jgi:hypothetical protein
VGVQARVRSRGEQQPRWDDDMCCFENNRLGGAGREREKGQRGRHSRGGRRRRERGACAAVGSTGWPAAAPGRWTWAPALFCEQGRAVGAGDAVRARLTGGAGRQWGPVVSGGVRDRVKEIEVAWQQALTCGPGQHRAGRRGLK